MTWSASGTSTPFPQRWRYCPDRRPAVYFCNDYTNRIHAHRTTVYELLQERIVHRLLVLRQEILCGCMHQRVKIILNCERGSGQHCLTARRHGRVVQQVTGRPLVLKSKTFSAFFSFSKLQFYLYLINYSSRLQVKFND
jgi:hypothetical protein